MSNHFKRDVAMTSDESSFVIKAPESSLYGTSRPRLSLNSPARSQDPLTSPSRASPGSSAVPSDSFMSTVKSPRGISLGSPGPRLVNEKRGSGGDAVPGPAAYGAPIPPRVTRGASVKLHGRELFGSVDYASRSTAASVPGPGTYDNIDTSFTRRGGRQQAPALKGRTDEKSCAGTGIAPDYYQGNDQSGVLGARPLSTNPSLIGPKFFTTSPTTERSPSRSATGGMGPGQYFAALQQDKNLSTRSGNPSFSLFSRRDEPKGAGAVSPDFRMPVKSCGHQSESTKKTAPALIA